MDTPFLATPCSKMRLWDGLFRTGSWRLHLTLLGLSWLCLMLIFSSDVRQMVFFWLTMSAYKHCALVIPLIAWLVWQRAEELRSLPVALWWPALGGVAAGVGLWLVGAAGDVALLRHAGLILQVQAMVPLFLGQNVARAALFPIFYLVFAIPFGEELVPIFQPLTAEMAIRLLHLAGVPAVQDGIFIVTPNGLYRVAQNCAGVKFLLAMVSYGVLVAHVCFKSTRRRIVYTIFSFFLPIIANGIRAGATIYVGYKTSPEVAGGVDHIVYGWLFFAIVMLAMFAAGWPFFERRPDDPWLTQFRPRPVSRWGSPLLTMALGVGLPLGAALWAHAMDSWGREQFVHQPSLPQVAGWEKVQPQYLRPWQPHYKGADQILLASYRNSKGQIIEFALVLYDYQSDGREVVGQGQGAAGTNPKLWAWSANGPKFRDARSEIIIAPGGVRRLAVTRYVIGGVATGSVPEVKLRTMATRLLGRSQAAAAVIISAQDEASSPAVSAVRAFEKALGPPENIVRQAVEEARH